MKLKMVVATCLLIGNSFALANSDVVGSPSRWAIQGAIATGGSVSIGVANYTECTEVGVTGGGVINTASNATKLFTPTVFAGLRKHLLEKTYFAYGLDLGTKLGKDAGKTVKADIQAAPYISLEQMLTHNLMLSGWINPYSYEYERKGNTSVSTHGIFSGGGIGLNYLF